MIMVINSTILTNNNLGIGTAMAIVMGAVILMCTLGQNWLTRERENL